MTKEKINAYLGNQLFCEEMSSEFGENWKDEISDEDLSWHCEQADANLEAYEHHFSEFNKYPE